MSDGAGNPTLIHQHSLDRRVERIAEILSGTNGRVTRLERPIGQPAGNGQGRCATLVSMPGRIDKRLGRLETRIDLREAALRP